jgi:hypothetical protein
VLEFMPSSKRLHHAPVAFGLIIGEWKSRIAKEAQCIAFARGEAQEEIMASSGAGICVIGEVEIEAAAQCADVDVNNALRRVRHKSVDPSAAGHWRANRI